VIKEEIWEFPKIGSKKQRVWYTGESVSHPAKMNTLLTRHLITTFTRPGDVVLDPMAGIGTTLVEAMLLGRNVVGVDIEEKFCKLMEGNLKNVKKLNKKSRFKLRLGKAQVLCGDSRNLARLLQDKMDAVVTSPPYSSGGWKADEDPSKPIEREKKRKKLFPMRPPDPGRYSASKENIGNLPHGESVDTVLTSPPYSGSVSKHAGGDKVRERFGGFMGESQIEARKYSEDEKNIGNLAEHGELDSTIKRLRKHGRTNTRQGGSYGRSLAHPYSDDERNIGNLQHGKVDAVVTSPPFSVDPKNQRHKSLQQFDKDRGFKADKSFRGAYGTIDELAKKNISQLREHGQVDTVITSPPFGEANRGSGIAKKGYSGKHGVDPKLHERHDRPLSDDPNNISNLPLGKVDTVITSPPFANIAKSREGGISPHMQGLISQLSGIPVEEFAHDVKKLREAVKIAQSKIPFKYSDDPQNIGNLKLGEVDAVLTSPPYAESLTKHNEQTEKTVREKLGSAFMTPGRLAAQKRMQGGYSNKRDRKNIGNLPPGKVDVVLTSPPYADIHQVPSDSPQWTAYFQQMLQEKGYIEWQGKRYTEAEWRRMNHGRIDGRSTKGLKKDAKYSDNPENIGNLEHESDVDAIITSPPYEATFNVKQHTLSGIARRDPNFRREVGGYGESEANIGNLRRGDKVDAIVTSPPYEGSVNAPNDPERRAERMQRAGYDPKTIVGGKARCGEIDWKYSNKPENIGNEKGETYLSAMLKCYREMYKVLKPNGLCIVVLKNFIRRWAVVDLIGDTIKLCEHVGFRLVKRIRFVLPTESFWRTNYRIQFQKRFGKPLPSDFDSVYKYETVLVFEKGLASH